MSKRLELQQVKQLISESAWLGFKFSEGFILRLTEDEQYKLIALLSKALDKEVKEE